MVVIMVAGILAYSNTANVPFLFDDSVRIVNNTKIRTLWPPFIAMFETNRPIVNYTFAMNYAIHGYNVWGYHAFNLAIHLAAGLGLYGIARRSFLRTQRELSQNADFLAFWVALIWVVHPLQTQAVTYINQRYESLMGLTYFLTLYAFIRAVDSEHPIRWKIASIVMCGLGMGCKEAMVSAPLIILWYDRAFVAKSWRELLLRRKHYYISLASTWAILAWAMLHYTDEYVAGGMVSVANVTPWTYLLSQSGVIVHYLRLSFWPQGQCFFGNWPIAQTIFDVLPHALCILSLLIGALWSLFQRPMLGFLGGWFFLILAPTSSIVPIRDFVFEHRMYLPLAAIVVLFVIGTYRLLIRSGLREKTAIAIHAFILFTVVLCLSTATYLRNQVYHSEISIWQDTVIKAPLHGDAWHNLGLSFVNVGKSSEAIRYLANASQLSPNDAKTHSSYGAALLESGQFELAKKHLAAAIQSDSKDHIALRNMGNLLLDTGKGSEAIAFCERAIELAPPDPELQMSLAAALIVAGRYDDAIRQCNQTLDDFPAYTKAHLNLVSVFSKLGKTDEAIDHARSAVRLEPNSANTHSTLGTLLSAISPDEAIEHLKTACDYDATNAELHLLLGRLLAKNHPKEAIPYYRLVVSNHSSDIESRYKLASLLVLVGELGEAIIEIEAIIKLRPESQGAKNYLLKLRKAASERP